MDNITMSLFMAFFIWNFIHGWWHIRDGYAIAQLIEKVEELKNE